MWQDYLFVASIVALCCYIFIQLMNMISIHSAEPDEKIIDISDDNNLPQISVLVAARNEESNIWRCLSALNNMQYPKDKLEVLIGNDDSEDKTGEIIDAFCSRHQGFRSVKIVGTLGKARGKANVLAQLAHEAKGNYFLITDADTAVNKYWAKEIISYFDDNTAIVSGITIVDDEGTMGRMQEIDWMYFMGLLKGFSNLGLSCTAVGNNMAVSRKAYEETGGYEALDFSVTEDYKLYKEVRKRGWKTRNILTPEILNRSRAIHQMRALLFQRKRWLIGARELPFYWWILFSVFGSFGVAIVVLAFFNIKLALIFYLIKLTLQSVSVFMMQNKLDIDKTFDYLVAYELYSISISLATQFIFFMPIKLRWKNRKYTI